MSKMTNNMIVSTSQTDYLFCCWKFSVNISVCTTVPNPIDRKCVCTGSLLRDSISWWSLKLISHSCHSAYSCSDIVMIVCSSSRHNSLHKLSSKWPQFFKDWDSSLSSWCRRRIRLWAPDIDSLTSQSFFTHRRRMLVNTDPRYLNGMCLSPFLVFMWLITSSICFSDNPFISCVQGNDSIADRSFSVSLAANFFSRNYDYLFFTSSTQSSVFPWPSVSASVIKFDYNYDLCFFVVQCIHTLVYILSVPHCYHRLYYFTVFLHTVLKIIDVWL